MTQPNNTTHNHKECDDCCKPISEHAVYCDDCIEQNNALQYGDMDNHYDYDF